MGIAFVVWLLWLVIAANYPGVGLCIAAAFFVGVTYLIWKGARAASNIHVRLACGCEDDARKQLKDIYNRDFPKMTELEKQYRINKFIRESYADGTFPKEWREE